MASPDFNIQIKVRNARLLRAMRAKGIERGSDLARAAGISMTEACALIGLKRRPVRQRDGQYTAAAMKVCEALDVMPDDIWPGQISGYVAPRAAPEIEISEEQVVALLTESSEDACVRRDLVERMSSRLNEDQAAIIARRFGFDGPSETYEEIAQDYGVSRERIRQREQRALRIMREGARRLGAV